MESNIFIFNYSELTILFMLMLNSVVYPNYISSGYFLYTLLMAALSMSFEHKTNMLKFALSIFMIVAAVIIGVSKLFKFLIFCLI